MKESFISNLLNKIPGRKTIEKIRPDLLERNRALGLPDDFPDAEEFGARVKRDKKVDEKALKEVRASIRHPRSPGPRIR